MSDGAKADDITDTAAGRGRPAWKIWAALDNSTTTIVGAIVAGGITIAGAALSPLPEIVHEWIWPERIKVEQSINVTEKVPASLSVVLQDDARGGGLSGGVISLASPDRSIEFIGPAQFTFPASAGSANVGPPGGLQIKALTFGQRAIAVAVGTNKGKRFKGTITVDVQRAGTAPLVGNLTGTWQITLNRVDGDLDLVENQNNHFTGSARLVDGAVLKANGWHDGEIFYLELTGAQRSFVINGIYCKISYGDEKWVVVNDKVVTLEKGRPIANPVAFGSILQRCPGFPFADKMTDVEGDGAFQATARLG